MGFRRSSWEMGFIECWAPKYWETPRDVLFYIHSLAPSLTGIWSPEPPLLSPTLDSSKSHNTYLQYNQWDVFLTYKDHRELNEIFSLVGNPLEKKMISSSFTPCLQLSTASMVARGGKSFNRFHSLPRTAIKQYFDELYSKWIRNIWA